MLCIVDAALAQCVTVKPTDDGPPYAVFQLENKCGGVARIPWTRKSDAKPETGSWSIDACSSAKHQYFMGRYTFGDPEFPSGGSNLQCLNKDDGPTRQKEPNKPAADLQRRLQDAQKKGGKFGINQC